MKKYLAPILLLTATSVPSFAGISGNALLDFCDSDSPSDISFCRGYVLGSTDLGIDVQFYGEDRHSGTLLKEACIPGKATLEQLVDVAIEYFKDNPEARHYTASSTIWLAMSEAFPCEE